MAFNFLYFVAGVFLLIILIIVGMYLVKIKREKEEPENQPIIINYHLSQSEGHAFGIIDDIEIGETRVKITFYPRDIDYIKEINKNPNFTKKPQIIFYDRKQVDVNSILDFSGHRTIIEAYPSDIEYLTEGIFKKKSWIAEKINENNELKDSSELLNRRMGNLKKVSKEVVGGELFVDFVKKSKEINKDLVDSIRKDEKKPFEYHKPQ